MSTQTTNLKLIKPEMSDYANITDISNNFDILDKAYDDLNSEQAAIRKKITSDIDAHNSSGTSHADIRRMFNSYLPLTGGRVSGRIHIDPMLSVGQSSAEASNIRVDGAAGNAYIALLNYNNVGNLLIDGYFDKPETATIGITNRDKNGKVRHLSTLMDGNGNAKFANDVYANDKLLATKEYVDGKKWGSTNITNGAITPTKLDRPYLPLTGGNVTGNITVKNNQVLYATNTITDQNGNYYTEYSDGSIVCGGIFTDLNQTGAESSHGMDQCARRVNYLKPITKTMIGMTAMLVPDDESNFWGNSSACAMLRQPDTTGFYVEIRSDYASMLRNTSKCMWRAYFK